MVLSQTENLSITCIRASGHKMAHRSSKKSCYAGTVQPPILGKVDVKRKKKVIPWDGITENDKAEAIRVIKRRKAAGLYEIYAQLLKHGGHSLVTELTTLFKYCWESQSVHRTGKMVLL